MDVPGFDDQLRSLTVALSHRGLFSSLIGRLLPIPKQDPFAPPTSERVQNMTIIAITARYARYVLTSLATVTFGMNLQ